MAFHFDSTFMNLLNLDLATGRVVPALMGEPGIGKSSFIADLAHTHGYKVFSIDVNTLADKGDLTGVRTVPTADGTSWEQKFFPHSTIVDCVNYAANHPDDLVLLNLEEINRADSDVTSAAMTLSTSRRIGNTILPDNVRLIISGNTKGNITTLDSASLTRFVLYEVEADAKTFLSVMGDNINPYIKKVLENKPHLVFCYPENKDAYVRLTASDDAHAYADDDNDSLLSFDDDDMRQYTTPRTIEGLSNWLNLIDPEFLTTISATRLDSDNNTDNSTILEWSVESHTGQTAFTREVVRTITEDVVSRRSANTQASITKTKLCSDLDNATTINEINDLTENASPEHINKAIAWVVTQNSSSKTTSAIVMALASYNRPERPEKKLLSQVIDADTNDLLDKKTMRLFKDYAQDNHPEWNNIFSMLL